MHILFFLVIVLIVLLAPGIWVQKVIKRYREPSDRYNESGAQLARRLLDAYGMPEVKVERTEQGDHYDPIAKAVRLSLPHHDGHSLAAQVIAAHEAGHALQDATAYPPLLHRTQWVRWVGPVEKIGAGLLMATPLIVGITRLPWAGALMLLGGVLTLGSAVLIHLLTLPTEFDASFKRALPMLDEQAVLFEGDEVHARKLLQAAAMTYVSASLMSLLNIARWWAILRR
jgi:Zn-dependent membrane protease YugP